MEVVGSKPHPPDSSIEEGTSGVSRMGTSGFAIMISMTISLRRALTDDAVEVPDHFEGVSLRTGVRLGGWFLGVVLAAGGIALMVLAAGTLFEALGACSAAAGAIALAAVVRCRRFETQIGRQWITIGAGPLTHRIRRDLVVEHMHRPATWWRRLFADDEIVLVLGVGEHRHVVPTRDPEELAGALGVNE